MGITVYWKHSNYKADTQQGFTFHFNSNQKRLHNQTDIGEDAFAISGFQTDSGFELFLLAWIPMDTIHANKKVSPNTVFVAFRTPMC